MMSGGTKGLSPTYEQAHVGLDLLILASLYALITKSPGYDDPSYSRGFLLYCLYLCLIFLLLFFDGGIFLQCYADCLGNTAAHNTAHGHLQCSVNATESYCK
mgnify:CR=1 FL=1